MRKFWAEVVKEDLRTLGMNRQFRRDERVRRILNSYEWIDSVQALAENREGWAELCSRTPPFDEDVAKIHQSQFGTQLVDRVPVVNSSNEAQLRLSVSNPFVMCGSEPWTALLAVDGGA
ncbi:hypothetical protein RB195_002033 [Necator americanus]|uniref:Uncharacterized protein n=1 Tax=Necator americanus TaxID=51031 RepID=A0ABR1DH26_NECAM